MAKPQQFMERMVPSLALQPILGAKPLNRKEITKRIWAYIKRRGLQDKVNRRMIHADATLRKVFGGKRSVNMFEMTKLVNKHLRPSSREQGKSTDTRPGQVRKTRSHAASHSKRAKVIKSRQLAPKQLPSPSKVSLKEVSEDKTLMRKPSRRPRATGSDASANGGPRRSSDSKKLGDQAENVVFEHLKSLKHRSLKHHSQSGMTPGYDLSYQEDGELVALEVKGTAGPSFANFALTRREREVAESMGRRYQLWLVTRVRSKTPVYQIIENPAQQLAQGILKATPEVWRIELVR